ncbi:hypothetical protein WM33_04675 [Burkholderia multivorans]|nr:hypothetical protein WM33_04675 [Burkholderia multivorans]
MGRTRAESNRFAFTHRAGAASPQAGPSIAPCASSMAAPADDARRCAPAGGCGPHRGASGAWATIAAFGGFCSGGCRAATAARTSRRSTALAHACRSTQRAARSAIGCAMPSIACAAAQTASACAVGPQ